MANWGSDPHWLDIRRRIADPTADERTPSAYFDVDGLAPIELSVSLGGPSRVSRPVAVLKLQGGARRADKVLRALDGERCSMELYDLSALGASFRILVT
jgi:hypothetical protein